MRRLTITLENYDDSKIVCSSILELDDESNTIISVLCSAGIDFSIEEVDGELFNFQLDDGDRYINLALRTKMEVEQWTYLESYESTVKGFLESRDDSMRISLVCLDAYLKIDRSHPAHLC